MTPTPPPRTIWRYQLPIIGTAPLDMPEGAQVLSVGPPRDPDNYKLDLWAVIDPRNDTPMGRVPRHFHIVGTGNPIPANAGAYVGTTHSHDGALIWHVFEVAERG